MLGWLLAKLEPIPKLLRVEDAGMEMDGGSLELTGTDERGKRRTVRLPVHPLLDDVETESKPRALYLGVRKLRMGSPDEFAVLRLLEQSATEIRSRPVDDADRIPFDSSDGVNVSGDPLLAEMAGCDSANERLAMCVEEVTNYLRSPESGRVWPDGVRDS
jgi:hypothetical protein